MRNLFCVFTLLCVFVSFPSGGARGEAHAGSVQSDSLERVSRSYREYSESQGPLTFILIVLLALGLVSIILYSILSNRERMVGKRVFVKLARANRLAGAELKLLIEVARRVQPENPSLIFVRRSLYEGAVADMTVDPNLVQSVRMKIYGP